MIEIYLGRNTKRNQELIDWLEDYGVAYTCVEPSQITREIIFNLFSKTSDCFDLLSPSFLRYKRQNNMRLNDFIYLVLQRSEQNLRLPLIVYKGVVYPDITLKEMRTFLPREVKRQFYQTSLLTQVTS
ncbi:hypothetical protein [Streptococcus marmotae]|uniref:hypothetical protein n=1 Tax=Streptococcus marmotae TaxID=1825069 RepID=UPI00082CB656|nr:hypothetical protein [Streptococcus marmotae]